MNQTNKLNIQFTPNNKQYSYIPDELLNKNINLENVNFTHDLLSKDYKEKGKTVKFGFVDTYPRIDAIDEYFRGDDKFKANNS